ncbi:methionine ABC transporter ATP-binding protein [Ruoffia tabacinasalis]|uniref:ATP-binding cassette domain-containing protein n=1 Tax=Ruoffia tabacinasalis TaxID=87458 RepID=A0ABS0LIQ1_9LACT|nr:ATP-binding cassette domain-containing protein [Ruoffia tabacinasalis]MBG9978165.1 ATP-binding cassette domain-containing protein [Ruoffia tabacinasalis]
MIELVNTTKRFEGKSGSFLAVDNISLSIKDQEVFGVVGESGAGKSTLVRFINALERPDSGQVLVDNVEVMSLSKGELQYFRKDIGMIFQQFNLLNNKTVAENVHLALEIHPYDDPLSVDEVLSFVGLSDKKDHYPSQLSGGQKQRVGIARALVTRPKILLCDEPTSALDAKMTDEIVSVLKRAHAKFNMTIVIVTHELDVIKAMCHRTAILEHGKLVDVLDIKESDYVPEAKSYHDRVLEVLTDD